MTSTKLEQPLYVAQASLSADLRTRQVTVSTHVDAPKEGRSKGRVSWLLRQLQNAPESMNIEARVARSPASLAASLRAARSTPDVLYPDASKEIRQFRLSFTQNMGQKRSAGKGSFINSVVDTTMDFYGNVLQDLRAWKARPPKLKKPPKEPSETLEELPEPIAEAALQAREEEGISLRTTGPGTQRAASRAVTARLSSGFLFHSGRSDPSSDLPVGARGRNPIRTPWTA